jgi:predicted lysophospholipase L1 biosynthesis ABC-type transport system permease subunit
VSADFRNSIEAWFSATLCVVLLPLTDYFLRDADIQAWQPWLSGIGLVAALFNVVRLLRLRRIRKMQPVAVKKATTGDGQNNFAPLVGGGIAIAAIAVMLGIEFFDPVNIGWDVFLGLFLLGAAGAAVLLGRFFLTHSAEIGEARFDTVERKH